MLKDKVIVITGGASPRGIGRATAKLFASLGATIAIVDLDDERSEQAAKELGPQHRGYRCDVARPDQCDATVKKVTSDLGPIYGLATFAGISRSTRFLDVSSEEFDQVFAINAKGTMNVCQSVVPVMIKERAGSIVLVASVAAQRGGGIFGGTHYSASKGAVLSLARAMARELACHGIRVNSVAPGLVETDIFEGKLTDARKAEIAATVPLQRVGRPFDVAGACAYLMSDWADYVTGATLDVNGGIHIH